MNRRLAVPLAVRGLECAYNDRAIRVRTLRGDEDAEDIEILRKLAENKRRIDCLLKDLEDDPEVGETPETCSELDYIKASVQLGLLEITGELEETPYSDELFEEATT